MEAKVHGGLGLPFSARSSSNKTGGKHTVSFLVNPNPKFGKRYERCCQMINQNDWQCRNVSVGNRGNHSIRFSCAYGDSHGLFTRTTLESGYFSASFNGNWLLKAKAQEVSRHLDERSIFLVGMMGSGKTTVGKILAEALGYSFVDSDKYVEQIVGGTSVTHIFSNCGENFFRDCESEALRQLSLMHRQVVATGGGAVVRPINWEYMRQGITVYLDVPLDALARRIAAVGTDSRPLLHFDSGDPYTQAFVGLFTLSKKRAESYATADARVSLMDLVTNLGVEDITDVTPTDIAIEVLAQIEKLLRGNSTSTPMFP